MRATFERESNTAVWAADPALLLVADLDATNPGGATVTIGDDPSDQLARGLVKFAIGPRFDATAHFTDLSLLRVLDAITDRGRAFLGDKRARLIAVASQKRP